MSKIGFSTLINRIKKGQESWATLLVRPIFLPYRWLTGGIKIMEKDWQVLIVLDACRFDDFKKNNWLPGKLKKSFSQGSHTNEWTMRNFKNYNLKDVVYISANPQVSRPKLKETIGISQPFHHLESVWRKNWNKKYSTTLPDSVSQAYLQLKKKYPNKKFILHFLQPHHPFIDHSIIKLDKKNNQIINSADWRPLFRKGYTTKQIRNAYQQNLKIVLKSIENIQNHLPKKTIITADHGEAFGELGSYGHVPLFYLPALVEIPWFELKTQK